MAPLIFNLKRIGFMTAATTAIEPLGFIAAATTVMEPLSFIAAATTVIESVMPSAVVLVIGQTGSGKSKMADIAYQYGGFEIIDVQTTQPEDYKTILPKITGTDKHLIIDGLDLHVKESEMVLTALKVHQDQGKGAIVTTMIGADFPDTRMFTAIFWIENEHPRVDGRIRFKEIMSLGEYDPQGMDYTYEF